MQGTELSQEKNLLPKCALIHQFHDALMSPSSVTKTETLEVSRPMQLDPKLLIRPQRVHSSRKIHFPCRARSRTTALSCPHEQSPGDLVRTTPEEPNRIEEDLISQEPGRVELKSHGPLGRSGG